MVSGRVFVLLWHGACLGRYVYYVSLWCVRGSLDVLSLWFVGYVSFVVNVCIGVVEHLVLVLHDFPAMGG